MYLSFLPLGGAVPDQWLMCMRLVMGSLMLLLDLYKERLRSDSLGRILQKRPVQCSSQYQGMQAEDGGAGVASIIGAE